MKIVNVGSWRGPDGGTSFLNALDLFDNRQVLIFASVSDVSICPNRYRPGISLVGCVAVDAPFPLVYKSPFGLLHLRRGDPLRELMTSFVRLAADSKFEIGSESGGSFVLTIGSETDLAILRMML